MDEDLPVLPTHDKALVAVDLRYRCVAISANDAIEEPMECIRDRKKANHGPMMPMKPQPSSCASSWRRSM